MSGLWEKFRQLTTAPLTPPLFFGLTLSVLTLLFLILYAVAPHGLQELLFWSRFQDFLADFFNHIAYVSDGDPYFSSHLSPADHIGTPLHYLLMLPLSQLADFLRPLRQLWSDPCCLALAGIFLAISEAALFGALAKLFGRRPCRSWFLALLFLSGINLAAMERGTLVILSAGCISGFLVLYDLPGKRARWAALALLSLAAALKIYPALFGLLLLRKRDWRGIAGCVVLTASLGFLPLLFFEHGFGNLPRVFENLAKYHVLYQFAGYDELRRLLIYSHWTSEPAAAATIQYFRLLVALGVLIPGALAFRRDDRPQLVLAIAAAITLIPVGAMPYTQLYLFPALLLFLRRERFEKSDYWLAAGFALLLMPLRIPLPFTSYGLLLNPFLPPLLLPGLLLLHCVVSFRRREPPAAA